MVTEQKPIGYLYLWQCECGKTQTAPLEPAHIVCACGQEAEWEGIDAALQRGANQEEGRTGGQ